MSASFGCTIINPAVPSGQDQAVVYQNTAATLTVTLTNDTGATVTFQAGSSPSTFEVYWPSFVTTAQTAAMQITPPANWKWDANQIALVYTGPGDASWVNGSTLVFTAANVVATAQPTSSSLQMNPSGMSGDIPTQVLAKMSLMPPPDPNNPNIDTVVQVSLATQGTIYVSPTNDPLPNTLFLTLKNMSQDALYSGSNMWKGNPRIIVTFVYGLTSGALAPDNDKSAPQTGSAWNIKGSVDVSQGNAWQVTNPDTKGSDPYPQWILQPTNTNKDIIGTGANANITFSFTNIISFTGKGHTQMTLQFLDFPATDSKSYNGYVYVMDIVKQDAPPTRGLINFYGKNPLATVGSPTDTVKIDVNWGMFYVDHVMLIPSIPGMQPTVKSYPNMQALAYDKVSVSVTNITVSTPVILTLQAYDNSDNYLNAMQYTVFINALEFVDPRDNKVYSAVQIGNLVWMSQNLDYNAQGSSSFYSNSSSYEVPYGQLYPWSLATPPAGGGWRLPTQTDWQNLIAAAGSNPYAALIAGGSSGFNAQLGGYSSGGGNFSGMAASGYYWTNTQAGGGGQPVYSQFSSSGQSVYVSSNFPSSYVASVRFVKDANS
jgi:uncharacterized protein (TIGR02145 family)